MKDYYKTLGVEKGASRDEIKKAFHKVAHQHHPDKNKNDPASAQKFKDASEAYSVLSDDNKRKQYDMFGSGGPGGAGFNNGSGGASGFGGFNPQDFGGFDFSGFTQGNGQGFEFDLGDIFGDFFGGRSGRSTGSSRSSSRRAVDERGSDISIDLTISFEESIFGASKDFVVTKTSKCLTCEGSGAERGATKEKCKVCNGHGRVSESRRSFLGVINTSKVCDNCHGLGEVPSAKCSTCHGTGVQERPQEINIKVPSGIEDGQSMRLSGMGEAVPFGVSGDLYVKVHVKPHLFIRKEGANLVTELTIKLTQALTGGDITLRSLDGDLIVKIPEGTNNNDVLRIKGKGVPSTRSDRGDLLIKIHISMPKKLSKEAKRMIEELRREGI